MTFLLVKPPFPQLTVPDKTNHPRTAQLQPSPHVLPSRSRDHLQVTGTVNRNLLGRTRTRRGSYGIPPTLGQVVV
jgi:hypothetical protein